MITRLRRDNVFLLMVDVQERLLPAIEGSEAVLDNTLKLIKAADVLSLPLFYTEQYPKGIGPTIKTAFDILPQDAVRMEKTAFSCCDEAGFNEKFLGAKYPTTLIFGIETHICVLSTAEDLLVRGQKVIVAADACGSRSGKNHELALAAMRAAGISVLPTETVIYQMMERAGTPEFKALLPLFK